MRRYSHVLTLARNVSRARTPPENWMSAHVEIFDLLEPLAVSERMNDNNIMHSAQNE